MSGDERVRRYFEADAHRFDAIYDSEKGPVSRFMDSVWRGVVRKRLELSLQRLQPLADKTVLDVGCGSGRFCIAYAQAGAARVVGVDMAAAMIDIARRAAERAGLSGRCDFRVGAFPDSVPDGPFDASTANGFFDYIADPVPILRCMRELTRSTMILSFPKAVEWRVPVRRLRFWINRCPLYLYREARVKRILADCGITRYDWISLDRDYFIVAHLEER